MFAKALEFNLWVAFVTARQERHTVVTLEHLLLTLLNDSSTVDVLRSFNANIDTLRENLVAFIEKNTPRVSAREEVDSEATHALQRVVQHALMWVRSTGNGKQEVTGAVVLMAMFREKGSHATSLLLSQNMTRVDVLNYIRLTGTKPSPSSA